MSMRRQEINVNVSMDQSVSTSSQDQDNRAEVCLADVDSVWSSLPQEVVSGDSADHYDANDKPGSSSSKLQQNASLESSSSSVTISSPQASAPDTLSKGRRADSTLIQKAINIITSPIGGSTKHTTPKFHLSTLPKGYTSLKEASLALTNLVELAKISTETKCHEKGRTRSRLILLSSSLSGDQMDARKIILSPLQYCQFNANMNSFNQMRKRMKRLNEDLNITLMALIERQTSILRLRMSIVDILMRIEVSDQQQHQQSLDGTNHSWSPGYDSNGSNDASLSEQELLHESWPRRVAKPSSFTTKNRSRRSSKQEQEQFEASQGKEMISSWLYRKDAGSGLSPEDYLGIPWPRPRVSTAKDNSSSTSNSKRKQHKQQQVNPEFDKWMTQSINTILELSDEEGASDFDFNVLLNPKRNAATHADQSSSTSTLDPSLDRWSVDQTNEPPVLLEDKECEPDRGRLMTPPLKPPEHVRTDRHEGFW